MWVSIPASVQSFNATKNTCVVQPTIKQRQKASDGSFIYVNLPLIQDVPIVWPGGGGFLVTFPLQANDEVLLVFSSRCMDTWWQQGGIQIPQELRLQEYSDAFCIPRIWSVPNVPVSISSNTAQLRSLDGTSYLELASGGVINIKAPGGLNLTGAMVATGEVTAKSTHTVSAHIHSDPQGGNTGPATG